MPTSSVPYVSAALGLLFAVSSNCQKLSDAPSYIDYPGLSTACLTALNITVTCPPFLSPASASGEILDSDLVTELCVDSCYTSLENARDTIQDACTASTDVIVHNNIAYPEGDDCNSVALGLGVSTYNLLYNNNLDIYCQNFASAVNSTLCGLDSCESVVSTLDGVTVLEFLSWNPNFNSLCQNSVNFLNYVVCVSPPGGYLNSLTTDTANSTGYTGGATTALPVPTNAMNGSNTDCGYWYTVVEGDQCALISVQFSLSLEDFYFLNPEVDANCTNLWIGKAYCIAPVGTITSYFGYPVTMPFISITSATFPSVTITMSTPTTGYVATSSVMPTASGMLSNCTDYRNYDSTNNLNNCRYIAFAEGIALSDFLDWNPSLQSTDCVLEAGYSYCVGNGSDPCTERLPDADTSAGSSYCLDLDATEPGTISTCNCFTRVRGYQNSTNGYSCSTLQSDYHVTLDKLLAWNSWMGSNCDTALFRNLSYYDTRAVCIGVDTSSPPTTSLTTIVTATTTTSSSMGPTQTDTVPGCKDITFAQFYAWNPSVRSNCSNLWLGYAYCVDGPTATGTTTASTTGPGAPT
ncbi:hypothetical protein BDV06DRAFT_234966 [Aspergillus oleicola]